MGTRGVFPKRERIHDIGIINVDNLFGGTSIVP
jgi:hypothetical protein